MDGEVVSKRAEVAILHVHEAAGFQYLFGGPGSSYNGLVPSNNQLFPGL